MKLVWKGIYKNQGQLPVGKLPAHAVKFKEPESMVKLNIVSAVFVIPVILIIGLAGLFKTFIIGSVPEITIFNLWGVLLALLMVIPHEFLHAVVFPRGSEVELWFMPGFVGAFIVSTAPISKARFIFLSLLPNIVFGFIPLLIWTFLPQDLAITNIVCSFAFISLLFGAGDYLNVWNATFQMPRGSMQQLSGMNSYWFMPK